MPSRHDGYRSNQVIQSPVPNARGDKVKMAQVIFQNADLAAKAREALNGFTLQKGWAMAVAFI